MTSRPRTCAKWWSISPKPRPRPTPCCLQGRATGTGFHFENRGASLVATGLGADVQVLNAGAEDLVVAQGAVDAGDHFVVDGGAAVENFRITAEGTDVVVEGLGTRIGIRNAGLAADSVMINGGAGDDTFDATGNLAPLAHLVLDGGAATTASTAATAPMFCWAATGMISSTGSRATTPPCSARATTCSSGIRAMAATRSKARMAPTR